MTLGRNFLSGFGDTRRRQDATMSIERRFDVSLIAAMALREKQDPARTTARSSAFINGLPAVRGPCFAV